MPRKYEAANYEERLRALAAEGKTCTGAATALGIHYKPTRRMADELGISFRQGGRGENPKTRWRRYLQRRVRRELAMDPVDRWA